MKSPTFRRRSVIIGGGAALAALAAPKGVVAQSARPVVETAQGRLRGVHERGVCIFRGIPYGGQVSAPMHRFKAPPPAPSWIGIRDASLFGAPAVQPPGGTDAGREPVPAEDCLFLNVWTPVPDGAKRPVMFYSHGGGFTVGSGGRSYQDGANLAREQDVVVVESNHRLGLFGYLYLGQLLGPDYQGNQGLQDLVAALAWVHQNIEAFGGDPDNVMIFGESGGGGKTTCLYAMPSAAPYFNKASIESAIGPENLTPDEATENARQLMKALEISDPRKLLEAPVKALLQYQIGDGPALPPGTRPADGKAPPRDHSRDFWPLIDRTVLPELPFGKQAPAISAKKPLIIGGCKNEAVFFSMSDKSAYSMDDAEMRKRLKGRLGDEAGAWIATFRKTRPNDTPSQLYMAIMTATPWRAHAVHIAESKARQAQAPVYAYIQDYQSPVPVPGTDYPIGAPHASDISLKFDNVDPSIMPAGSQPGLFNADLSEARRLAARNMSTMWATFARTGRPGAPGQPGWPAYTLEKRETMLIKAHCEVVSDPEGAERRFWQSQKNPEAVR